MTTQIRKNLGCPDDLAVRIARVQRAALDQSLISGLTHQFYRYPARFSPCFVRAAIESFSSPGDVVLDPFMGGGTTIVEAYATGRSAIGNDVNSLALFIASAKLQTLSDQEQFDIRTWALDSVPNLSCHAPTTVLMSDRRCVPHNMSLPRVRWLKKTVEQCLGAMADDISTARGRRFARCVILNVGQWALNGRRRIPSAAEFRDRVAATAIEMLDGVNELRGVLGTSRLRNTKPILVEGDAEALWANQTVQGAGPADLIVTSPPYPGIHMLYHRWQVDGRKESNAPYWIAASNDGAGAAFYNFADRRRAAEDHYFQKAERAFSSIRQITRDGAALVQLIAFSDPQRQMRRYLGVLERAGFRELRRPRERRTWRAVPSRRWHANSKGDLPSSREVMLVHQAV